MCRPSLSNNTSPLSHFVTTTIRNEIREGKKNNPFFFPPCTKDTASVVVERDAGVIAARAHKGEGIEGGVNRPARQTHLRLAMEGKQKGTRADFVLRGAGGEVTCNTRLIKYSDGREVCLIQGMGDRE